VQREPQGLCLSSDHKYRITSNEANALRVEDHNTQKERWNYTNHPDTMPEYKYSAAIAPEGNLLIWKL